MLIINRVTATFPPLCINEKHGAPYGCTAGYRQFAICSFPASQPSPNAELQSALGDGVAKEDKQIEKFSTSSYCTVHPLVQPII